MSSEGVNPYELLKLSIEATEQEIKTAYRQTSLKVHPDRVSHPSYPNHDNPDAARKFHELECAQEHLLDPDKRKRLDEKLRSKENHEARYAKCKELVEELEKREPEAKKAWVDREAEQDGERLRENERIMEEGRQLREQKGLEREALWQRAQQEATRAGVDPLPSGPLNTTVRIKYTLSSRPTLIDAATIAAVLTPFGAIDEPFIVLSLPPAPPKNLKKPKRATALVPFTRIESAFAAVCASGRAEHGLQDIEVTWASGTEPEPINWLKKMGQLGRIAHGKPSPSIGSQYSIPTPGLGIPSLDDPFSSSSSTFPALQRPTAPMAAPGLAYESLALMRMREAERERLKREIREQEAAESD